jgi:hypothetical protein
MQDEPGTKVKKKKHTKVWGLGFGRRWHLANEDRSMPKSAPKHEKI